MLQGKKILLVGATGMVGEPVAAALARDNDVFGVARFGDDEVRRRLETQGINCVKADLLAGDLSQVPTDCDHVLNFAVSYSPVGDFDYDLSINAEAAGLVMAHCAGAESFLHCSSTAVYADCGREPRTETHPLADFSRITGPTYSITKIASEAVVRAFSRHLGMPTVIARLNVPYSDRSGWPAFHVECVVKSEPVYVHTDAPSVYAPIHTDDMVRTIPALLDSATVPANIVNWGGSDEVSIEDWSSYVGELVGKPVRFEHTDMTMSSVVPDVTKLQSLVDGEISSVPWRDGIRRMVTALHPELELSS
jgi:nucleoside-diphosphate-sugar epimerase